MNVWILILYWKCIVLLDLRMNIKTYTNMLAYHYWLAAASPEE